jgi:hypothetical protein
VTDAEISERVYLLTGLAGRYHRDRFEHKHFEVRNGIVWVDRFGAWCLGQGKVVDSFLWYASLVGIRTVLVGQEKLT